MFYIPPILGRKGPLALVWLAAHSHKRLTKGQVMNVNIHRLIEMILDPELKLSLRISADLMEGICRLNHLQARYIISECNRTISQINAMLVSLPMYNRGKNRLTLPDKEQRMDKFQLPEIFELFDMDLPPPIQIDPARLARRSDITLNELVPTMEELHEEEEIYRRLYDLGDNQLNQSVRMEDVFDSMLLPSKEPQQQEKSSLELIDVMDQPTEFTQDLSAILPKLDHSNIIEEGREGLDTIIMEDVPHSPLPPPQGEPEKSKMELGEVRDQPTEFTKDPLGMEHTIEKARDIGSLSQQAKQASLVLAKPIPSLTVTPLSKALKRPGMTMDDLILPPIDPDDAPTPARRPRYRVPIRAANIAVASIVHQHRRLIIDRRLQLSRLEMAEQQSESTYHFTRKWINDFGHIQQEESIQQLFNTPLRKLTAQLNNYFVNNCKKLQLPTEAEKEMEKDEKIQNQVTEEMDTIMPIDNVKPIDSSQQPVDKQLENDQLLTTIIERVPAESDVPLSAIQAEENYAFENSPGNMPNIEETRMPSIRLIDDEFPPPLMMEEVNRTLNEQLTIGEVFTFDELAKASPLVKKALLFYNLLERANNGKVRLMQEESLDIFNEISILPINDDIVSSSSDSLI